jgi:hypothetical protein
MPQEARGVVGHGVCSTGNVVVTHVISVVALMKTGKAKKISCRIAGSDGAFGDTADGRRVIVEKGEGAFAGINGLGENVLVGNDARKLKVADREVASPQPIDLLKCICFAEKKPRCLI